MRRRGGHYWSKIREMERVSQRLRQDSAARLEAMSPEEKAARKAEAVARMKLWLEDIERANRDRAARREDEKRRREDEVQAAIRELPKPPPRRTRIVV